MRLRPDLKSSIQIFFTSSQRARARAISCSPPPPPIRYLLVLSQPGGFKISPETRLARAGLTTCGQNHSRRLNFGNCSKRTNFPCLFSLCLTHTISPHRFSHLVFVRDENVVKEAGSIRTLSLYCTVDLQSIPRRQPCDAVSLHPFSFPWIAQSVPLPLKLSSPT